MHKYWRVSPQFPGLPLPAKPGSFLLMQILYKKGVSKAGSWSRKIPQAKLELHEHLWQAWLYSCKVILFAIQLETRTLQENAGPAVGSLSGAITIDKDEEFREFTDNSNEESHQMWVKAYFSSRTERKQALKIRVVYTFWREGKEPKLALLLSQVLCFSLITR